MCFFFQELLASCVLRRLKHAVQRRLRKPSRKWIIFTAAVTQEFIFNIQAAFLNWMSFCFFTTFFLLLYFISEANLTCFNYISSILSPIFSVLCIWVVPCYSPPASSPCRSPSQPVFLLVDFLMTLITLSLLPFSYLFFYSLSSSSAILYWVHQKGNK